MVLFKRGRNLGKGVRPDVKRHRTRHDYIKYALVRHTKRAISANSVILEPILEKIELEAHDLSAGNIDDMARSDASICDFQGPHTITHIDIGQLFIYTL